MQLLKHSAKNAIIKLDQRELLLLMALIEKGRDSFGCNTESAQALDDNFCLANLLVEWERRKNLETPISR